ncbi:MAG: hypothetical protein BGO59_03855 [Spirosoma sp. 48-14]|nr:MAG: hypothetical protein BGO59_03855 [Spirosoma sp. 48-14]
MKPIVLRWPFTRQFNSLRYWCFVTFGQFISGVVAKEEDKLFKLLLNSRFADFFFVVDDLVA